MKFTVDRSKWKNAKHGKGFSQLLNTQGFRCCLGFCEMQLGIKDTILLDAGTPGSLDWRASKIGEKSPPADNIFTYQDLGLQMTTLTREAMTINDNCAYSDSERESKLQAAFIEAGHEIEFIGEFQD